MKHDKKIDPSLLTAQQKIWIDCSIILRAFWPLILYVVMPALFATIGYMLFHSNMEGGEFFTYGGNFYTALGMIATFFILRKRSKKRGESFCEDATLYIRKDLLLKGIGFFVFGVFSAIAVSSLVTLLGLGESGYRQSLSKLLEGPDFIFSVITVGFLSPILEEVVFRGYMLNTLLRHFKKKTAVSITVIAFMLCHIHPIWMIYAGGMGFLLICLSMIEENILEGIFVHIGFNLPSVVLAFLYQQNPMIKEGLGRAVFQIPLFLLSIIVAFMLAYIYLRKKKLYL
ncbi:MAG: lysostaphin resistance A-like protein [Catonella sp.]|uniref:CPBP family intramembrane glutamic endopeptidase n=1 Tax=Catonella sp. TaxID=2382125 RepID=UPI003F9F7ED2